MQSATVSCSLHLLCIVRPHEEKSVCTWVLTGDCLMGLMPAAGKWRLPGASGSRPCGHDKKCKGAAAVWLPGKALAGRARLQQADGGRQRRGGQEQVEALQHRRPGARCAGAAHRRSRRPARGAQAPGAAAGRQCLCLLRLRAADLCLLAFLKACPCSEVPPRRVMLVRLGSR